MEGKDPEANVPPSSAAAKSDERLVVPISRIAGTLSKLESEGLISRQPAIINPGGPVDIVEEPNPLELSKEALARRPSFRKIYNDLASADLDLKQFQQHANVLSQLQLAAAQAQAHQQQAQEDNPQPSEAVDTHQILQQTLQLQSMLLNAGINPAQAISFSQNQISLSGNTTNSTLSAPTPQLFSNPAPTIAVESITNQISSTLDGNNTLNQAPEPPKTSGAKLSVSPAMTAEELAEESQKKREIRLRKNRDAAKECRRKKKEYVRCLENRVAVLESQNQALIGELRALKELYLPKTDSS